MRILVVLVTAIFTGCNANLFYADEPKSKLDQLTDAFWGYVDGARQTADDTLEKIQQTEIAQDVSARLQNGAEVANLYAEIAWEQVPPMAKDAMEGAGMLLYGVSLRAEEGMTNVKRNLEPLTERVAPVAERVQSGLTQGAEQVLEMASPYFEKLRDSLEPVAKQVQTKVTGLVDSLVGSN
ncbi:apolipoprotein Eb-like [Cheilinus undulatus]|uniref:apolipoprotein Eb-like n=1 Tax=Cheilinus undulatus TaxID=241271 RepID=UPI001BD572DC|nr:apolipoprotein Eb-like [Cheilinus undulatus]